MKITAVIPARYASTRFPGKPMKDICGKPMLWWVYQAVSKIEEFQNVVCAIDDHKIRQMCQKYELKYIDTRDDHPNHISRIQEVSEKVKSDFYVCINGDEPLISRECILPVLPNKIVDEPYFGCAMRILNNPAETIDSANIKVVVSENTGRCLYMSRTPVPYPKGTLFFSYRKYVGVECFNKKALDFFVNTPMGSLEKVEDIDQLRFLENGVNIKFTEVQSQSISVDTPKDLEKVRCMVRERIENGEIAMGGGKKLIINIMQPTFAIERRWVA